MAKLVLSDLANLSNPSSAVATINANNDRIVDAIENTLSRDGETPNQMTENLDMNSNRILNLPSPNSDQEPLRAIDLQDFLEGNLTINEITQEVTQILTMPGVFSITDYGGEEGTDCTEALQDTIDACAEAGGGTVLIGPGNYYISETIVIENDCVLIEGAGAPYGASNRGRVNSATSEGTRLIWDGADGGTMMVFYSPVTNILSGGGIKKVAFLSDDEAGTSDNVAAVGLRIESMRYAEFSQLYFQEFSNIAFICGPLENGSHYGIQQCKIDTIFAVQDEQSGRCMEICGNPTESNTSIQYIFALDMICNEGTGIIFRRADNVVCYNVRVFCNAGLSGVGLTFAAVEDGQFATQNNHVFHYSSNAPTIFEGTESNDTPCQYCSVQKIDRSNNTPRPTYQTGVTGCFHNFDTDPAGEWRTWTPTISSTSGTITSASSVEDETQYMQVNRIVFFQATLRITTNGTGSGKVRFTLPTSVTGNPQISAICHGRKTSDDTTVHGTINTDGTVDIVKYDGSYPGANDQYINVQGFYRVSY